MKKSRAGYLLAVCLLNSSGCLAKQVCADGQNFRQSLLDMYTNQLMDNLIRAHENKPFVQLKYRNLIVTDAQLAKANIATEYDPTSTRTVSQLTAALITSMSGFTDKLFYGASLECDRTMQFIADPVTGANDVYDYYQAFAHDPELLMVSEAEPGCDAYIKKQCGPKWYWVPAEAGGVFLQLALKTTFMRGADTPPPIVWSTAIASVEPRYDEDGNEIAPPLVDYYEYTVTFLREVPNDTGQITITLPDCKTATLDTRVFDDFPLAKGQTGQKQKRTNIKQGDPTFVLYGQSAVRLDWPNLANAPAQVYTPYSPNLGTKDADLQRLEAAVERFRCAKKQRR